VGAGLSGGGVGEGLTGGVPSGVHPPAIRLPKVKNNVKKMMFLVFILFLFPSQVVNIFVYIRTGYDH
jgi:hypothetical protein